VHTCEPNPTEAETGRSQIPGQPGLQKEKICTQFAFFVCFLVLAAVKTRFPLF
jgi:hypothetical protein